MNQNKVRLINVTPDTEKTVLYIARVSSKHQDSTETGLINYLIKNGHWSPFEHAVMTLEIVTSRAISQQITRHRSFTFQEFSQRYALINEWIIYEGRLSGGANRQAGDGGPLSDEDEKWWYDLQKRVAHQAFSAYDQAIEKGIAPEVARFVLPLSTQTKIYMTGTLRSWIHYLGDGPGGRTNIHTQKEHRDIALKGKDIFCTEFPIIAEALGWLDG